MRKAILAWVACSAFGMVWGWWVAREINKQAPVSENKAKYLQYPDTYEWKQLETPVMIYPAKWNKNGVLEVTK